MRRFYLFLTICFLLTNLFGQSISLAPQFVYSIFDSRSNLESTSGYGINLESKLSEQIAAAFLYKYIPTHQKFSTPAGNTVIQINMHLYGLQFLTPLIKFNTESGTSIYAGAGGSTFKTASRIIDLGALGEQRLASKSTTHFTYWTGLSGYYHIFPFLRIHIEPHIAVIDTKGGNYINYMLAGGMAIEL
jgi:hypothetical protein